MSYLGTGPVPSYALTRTTYSHTTPTPQMTTIDENGLIESDIDAIIFSRSVSLPSDRFADLRSIPAASSSPLTTSIQSLISGNRRSAFNVYRKPQTTSRPLEPINPRFLEPLRITKPEVKRNEDCNIYSPDSGRGSCDLEHVYETIDDVMRKPSRRHLIPPPLPERRIQSPAYISPIRTKHMSIKTNPRRTLRHDPVRDKHASTSVLPHYASIAEYSAPFWGSSMQDVSRCRRSYQSGIDDDFEFDRRLNISERYTAEDIALYRMISRKTSAQYKKYPSFAEDTSSSNHEFETQAQPWRPLHGTLC